MQLSVITVPTQAKPSAEQVIESMFDRIAPRYDLANRLLSFGQDIRWRKTLARQVPQENPTDILDIATGTADVAIELARVCPRADKIYGIDTAEEMLSIGRKKIRSLLLENKITLMTGNALSLPFPDNRFDVITIAFGIRNVTDVPKALKEMHRVCKPGGQILILEFSLPHNFITKKIYLLYFRHVLPLLAGLITGDRDAYRYLNRTVETFPYGEQFTALIRDAGFDRAFPQVLTFGIASLYHATKRGSS